MPNLKPPNYILASVAIAIGGLCNGLASTRAPSAPSPQWPSSQPLSPSLRGFAVSLVMLAGAVPAFFAGYLADRLGRLRIVLLGAALYVLGAALQASATSVAHFLLGKALGGLGQGVYLGNVSVYICEIAPVRHRGILVGLPQFMATAGICLGYFTCYASVDIKRSMAWRLPCIVQGCTGGLLGLACLLLPESPHWLMMRGQNESAVRALQRLDFDMVEAERDILTSANEQRPSLSLWQSIVILFRRAYRSRTIMALFMLGMVQLSGIDAVIYYDLILFSQAGLTSSTASFLASGASAIAMLAISIPAFLFVDKWGRRTCAITGGATMCSCMFFMGILYAGDVVHPWGYG